MQTFTKWLLIRLLQVQFQSCGMQINVQQAELLNATAATFMAVTPSINSVGAQGIFLEGLFTQRRRFSYFMINVNSITSSLIPSLHRNHVESLSTRNSSPEPKTAGL